MADLAAAGAAYPAYFAYAVGRHIVLMHVPLEGNFVNTVKVLTLGKGCQSGDGHYLGLAAGKYAAAVYAGQNAYLAPDGTDLILGSSVGTDLAVDYLIPDDFLGQVVEYHVDVGGGLGIFLGKVLDNLGLNLLAALLAHLAVKGIQLPLYLLAGVFANLLGELLVGLVDVYFHLGLAALGSDALDEGNDLLYLFVGQQYGVQHFLFGQLVCACLNHHNGILGACYGQVQAAVCALLLIGVDDVFAVYHANRHCADGAHKGGIAQSQSGGCAYHAKNFGLNIGVNGKNRCDYLNVIVEALGEQRAKRTVDKTAGQDGLLGRAAFTLDVTAGDLAYGVHLFFELDGQGEEINAVTGCLGYGSVYHNNSIAHANKRASAGLLTVFAGFDGQGLACQLH